MTSKAEQAAKEWIEHVIKSQCDVNYEISFLAGVRWAVKQAHKDAIAEGFSPPIKRFVKLSDLKSLLEDGGE